jgi:hypothetical protein
MLLAAMGEAGLAVAASADHDAVQREVRGLLFQILRGLRPGPEPTTTT